MNYKRHYNLLIERAKDRLLEGYIERHHIIPKCMGGTNEKENLVKLTAEEHFLAHQLLIKMYPNEHKLVYAAQIMAGNKHGHRTNNKVYGWIRRKVANAHRLRQKGKTLEELLGLEKAIESKRKNSEARKGKVLGPRSEETKLKIKNSMKGKNTGPKPLRTEEHKRRNAEALRGKTYEEIYGIERAKEQKSKLSKAHKNQVPWNKGKKHSEESIQKMRDAKRKVV